MAAAAKKTVPNIMALAMVVSGAVSAALLGANEESDDMVVQGANWGFCWMQAIACAAFVLLSQQPV